MGCPPGQPASFTSLSCPYPVRQFSSWLNNLESEASLCDIPTGRARQVAAREDSRGGGGRVQADSTPSLVCADSHVVKGRWHQLSTSDNHEFKERRRWVQSFVCSRWFLWPKG